MTAATLETLSLLGVLLLVGGLIADRLVFAGLPSRRALLPDATLRIGVLAGAILVVVAGAADVAWTLHAVVGRIDGPLLLDYLPATRHGRATIARIALVVPTAALAWRRGAVAATRRTGRSAAALAVALSVPLLATFSWTSHAAAMGGVPPLLADLAHLAAAAAWGGSLLYLALSPAWAASNPRATLTAPLRRVSRVGLASVGVLAASGAFAALTHMEDPQRFASSAYGAALFVKLGLVAVIVTIAAGHRWVFLPALAAGRSAHRLRVAVRLEALVLVIVIAATGVLATRAVPHGPDAGATALDNALRLVRQLGW